MKGNGTTSCAVCGVKFIDENRSSNDSTLCKKDAHICYLILKSLKEAADKGKDGLTTDEVQIKVNRHLKLEKTFNSN